VAVVVGKHGHSIVDRNRLRRQLRELARLNLLPVCAGIDIVLHALADAYDAKFSVLTAEIQILAEKLGSEVLDR
jgi:ribonuclease P protein component